MPHEDLKLLKTATNTAATVAMVASADTAFAAMGATVATTAKTATAVASMAANVGASVSIKTHDHHHEMKHKQVLAIREKPLELQEDVTIKETREIKTWCCCSQGNSSLKAQFNKNVFTPMEVA